MTSHNPYSPPQASLEPRNSGGDELAASPKGVDAGRGASWFSEGWNLFKQAAGLWIGMIVVYAIIMIALGMVPLLSLLNTLLGPVFTAGFMLGCRALERGDGMQFSHLFAGFSQRTGTLVGVGGLYLAGTIAVFVVAGLVALGSNADLLMGAMTGAEQDPEKLAELGTGFMLAVLIALALILPLVMAMWFAPALVVLHGKGAIEAMKLSFTGCLRNILPFLVYGIVGLVLAVIASIPLMLGWLVLAPMIIGSMYAAYKDIFLES
jgi:uncharacterized membrane protein